MGPYGLQSRQPGSTSNNTLVRNGRRIKLAGKTTTTIKHGDIFEHRTAGAGGWGPARRRAAAAHRRDQNACKVTD